MAKKSKEERATERSAEKLRRISKIRERVEKRQENAEKIKSIRKKNMTTLYKLAPGIFWALFGNTYKSLWIAMAFILFIISLAAFIYCMVNNLSIDDFKLFPTAVENAWYQVFMILGEKNIAIARLFMAIAALVGIGVCAAPNVKNTCNLAEEALCDDYKNKDKTEHTEPNNHNSSSNITQRQSATIWCSTGQSFYPVSHTVNPIYATVNG